MVGDIFITGEAQFAFRFIRGDTDGNDILQSETRSFAVLGLGRNVTQLIRMNGHTDFRSLFYPLPPPPQ